MFKATEVERKTKEVNIITDVQINLCAEFTSQSASSNCHGTH